MIFPIPEEWPSVSIVPMEIHSHILVDDGYLSNDSILDISEAEIFTVKHTLISGNKEILCFHKCRRADHIYQQCDRVVDHDPAARPHRDDKLVALLFD